jgi:Tautomerase enzyme
MPLVRIDLLQGTSPEYRERISEGVQQAMVESLAVPAGRPVPSDHRVPAGRNGLQPKLFVYRAL